MDVFSRKIYATVASKRAIHASSLWYAEVAWKPPPAPKGVGLVEPHPQVIETATAAYGYVLYTTLRLLVTSYHVLRQP